MQAKQQSYMQLYSYVPALRLCKDLQKHKICAITTCVCTIHYHIYMSTAVCKYHILISVQCLNIKVSYIAKLNSRAVCDYSHQLLV